MSPDFAQEKGGKKQNPSAASVSAPAPVKSQQTQEQPEPQQAEEAAALKAEKPKKEKKDKKKDKAIKTESVEELTPAAEPRKEGEKQKKKDKRQPKEEAKTEVKAEIKTEVKAEVVKTEAKTESTEHVQSERNARRREVREFLRQVQARKDQQARPEDKSVMIYGLGQDVTQKQLAKKIKKIAPASKIELKSEEKTQKQFALVQFEKIDSVQVAIQKLDHHIFKGAMLKVVSMANAGPAGAKGDPKATKEGLRMIVRNLAFQTTDEDLEKLFVAYGPLFEARVVRMPVDEEAAAADPNALGRSRGFGFVQYRDVNDAKLAVEKLNGHKIKGREMIVDFALSKTQYLEQQKEQQDAPAADDEDGEENDDGEEAGTDDEAGEDSEIEGSLNGDDDEEMEDDDDDDEEDDEPAAPKVDTDAQRNRTIFIRNLSFQSTEEGLKEFFSTFGAVDYARVVYDKGSGLSKGVAFVRFKDIAVADRVIQRGELAQQNNQPQSKYKKKDKKENLFTLSALADGDALMLDGRMLSITRAVNKDDADRLTETRSTERKNKDKRNLYLAYEGTINVNKVADVELMMPKIDIDKRHRAIREKKEKLKNPMYFVSPVRLSVRNLGTHVDEKQLKDLFREAATNGMKQNKVDNAEVKRELLPSKASVPVKVKMAKVVRDTEAAKAGKEARSRGYGFVEFSEHVHALAALRVVNNMPAYTSLAAGGNAKAVNGKAKSDNEKSRLIVEFALENHGKLKLREKRKTDADKKREEAKVLLEAQGGGSKKKDAKKKSRGQRQRENKKLAKEEPQEEAKTDGKPVKKAAVVVTSKPQPKKRQRAEASGHADVDAAMASADGDARSSKKAKKPTSRKERKHAKEVEQERSFDDLVRTYKKDLFGEKKPAASAGGDSGAADSAANRWFD